VPCAVRKRGNLWDEEIVKARCNKRAVFWTGPIAEVNNVIAEICITSQAKYCELDRKSPTDHHVFIFNTRRSTSCFGVYNSSDFAWLLLNAAKEFQSAKDSI